jgi:hypothetical protein
MNYRYEERGARKQEQGPREKGKGKRKKESISQTPAERGT